MKRILTGYVCLAAVFGLSSLRAETISGTVYDVSGAVVPNAAVTIVNPDTKASQFVVTGADGSFQAVGLAPGNYRVDFEARGFRLTREFAALKAGETQKLTPVLQLGRVAETITVRSKGTPAFAAPSRVRVGGNVEAAKVLKAPRIAYPDSAKAKGATGSVVLRAVILMDGTLGNPSVVRSPDADLTAAAVEAVKQWRYVPTKLNGQPVETETLIEVNFELGQ
jgi:TonB family protein